MVGVIVGFTAQQDVNQGVDVGDVDFAVTIHVACADAERVWRERLTIFFNLEFKSVEIKREGVLPVGVSEHVGVIVVGFLCGVGHRGGHRLTAVAVGTVAVVGVKVIPVAGKTVSKNEPHRFVDVGCQGVDAVPHVCHLDTMGWVPPSKGTTADYIDGCLCRHNRQHKRHSGPQKILLHLLNLG